MAEPTFKPFCLEVWADYACFTRPEMKVERVSYDVPTPSAVRAVFEAVFWKPAVRWQVERIKVLNPIKWISVRRNELGAVMSPRSDGLYIEEHRQQRAGLFLRDVRYRFYAVLQYLPVSARPQTKQHVVSAGWPAADEEVQNRDHAQSHKDETPGKYLAMFERRARNGQCFTQPYLGCREFSCHFRWIEPAEAENAAGINETKDLGYMLYDMDFSDVESPQPMFFRARLDHGQVFVPERDSKEVLR
jgi:CRISPR-associated protein Cas5d